MPDGAPCKQALAALDYLPSICQQDTVDLMCICREHATLLITDLMPPVTLEQKREALDAAAAFLLSKGASGLRVEEFDIA